MSPSLYRINSEGERVADVRRRLRAPMWAKGIGIGIGMALSGAGGLVGGVAGMAHILGVATSSDLKVSEEKQEKRAQVASAADAENRKADQAKTLALHDELKKQLSDIATDLRSLRRKLKAPPSAASATP